MSKKKDEKHEVRLTRSRSQSRKKPTPVQPGISNGSRGIEWDRAPNVSIALSIISSKSTISLDRTVSRFHVENNKKTNSRKNA